MSYATLTQISPNIEWGDGEGKREIGERGCKKALLIGGFSQTEEIPQEDLAHIVDFSTGSVERLELSHLLPDGLSQHTTETFDGQHFYILGNCCGYEWRPLVVNVATRQVALARVSPAHPRDVFPLNQHCHVSAHFTSSTSIVASPLPDGTPDRLIFMFGGVHVADRYNLQVGPQSHDMLFVWSLNARRWSRVTSSPQHGTVPPCWPPKRLYHAGCAVENRFLFIFGGAPDCKTTTGDDVVFDDLWCLDAETVTWRLVAPRGNAPTKRGSCTMVYRRPFIYLYGGFDGTNSLADMYRFHVLTEVWQEIAGPGDGLRRSDDDDDDGPVAAFGAQEVEFKGLPRWGAASCLMGSDVFVVGGMTERRAREDDPEEEEVEDGRPPYRLTSRGMRFRVESPSLKLFAALFLAPLLT